MTAKSTFYYATICVFIILLNLACASQKVSEDPKRVVYARLDGKPLTGEGILDKTTEARLLQIRRKEANLIQNAVSKAVDKALVEREASRRKMTVDQLMDDVSKVQVSDDEVKDFYKARHKQDTALKEDEFEVIRSILKNAKGAIANRNFMNTLRSQAHVEMLLNPPREVAEVVTPGSLPPLKDNKADVVIVEFGEYECPYCNKVRSTLSDLQRIYKDRINLYFRNFIVHQGTAQLAAEAAACAAKQNKFWEYHNALFDNERNHNEKDLENLAAKLALSAEPFNKCLEKHEALAVVENDLEDAKRYGVDSTPWFFVNGRVVTGDQSFEDLSIVINEELEKNKRALHL
jgi:protein-disulfide isomerase